MTDPVTVFIGSLDLAAVKSVTQKIIIIGEGGEEEKRDILLEFLQNMNKDEKVIVFVGKKSKVDDISSDLSLKGITVQSIHGDREQSDRGSPSKYLLRNTDNLPYEVTKKSTSRI